MEEVQIMQGFPIHMHEGTNLAGSSTLGKIENKEKCFITNLI